MSAKKTYSQKTTIQKAKPYLLALLSATLFKFSIALMSPLIGLVAFIPMLLATDKATIKQGVGIGAAFGFFFGVYFFSWMLGTAVSYNGSLVFGLAAMTISMLIIMVHYALLFWIYGKLTRNILSVKNIFIFAAITAILLYGFQWLFTSMPFYAIYFGQPLFGGSLTIQLAEFGGIYILTFCVLVINGLIACDLNKRSLSKATLIIIGIFLACNIGLYYYRSPSKTTKKEAKISLNLLNGNINPQTNWRSEVQTIVHKLFSLNDEAARHPADFNVWTETVVHWSYKPNDYFIKTILNKAQSTGTATIIGLFKYFSGKQFFNSAFVFNPNKKIIGRYDKVYPIKILEAPLGNLIPVVVNTGGSGSVIKRGTTHPIFHTSKGNFGVYICNEATTFKAVRPLVLNGAQFLVNISNDGWFNGNYMVKLHFYYNRLRAVETRRDVAANNNNGYMGLFKANGEVVQRSPNPFPEMMRVNVSPKNSMTIFTQFPYLFLIVCLILIPVLLFLKKKKETSA